MLLWAVGPFSAETGRTDRARQNRPTDLQTGFRPAGAYPPPGSKDTPALLPVRVEEGTQMVWRSVIDDKQTCSFFVAITVVIVAFSFVFVKGETYGPPCNNPALCDMADGDGMVVHFFAGAVTVGRLVILFPSYRVFICHRGMVLVFGG